MRVGARTLAVLPIAITIAFAIPISAQSQATLLLRSGEKIAGQLVDLNGDGLTLVVNGREQPVPLERVAAIDFTGASGTDWSTFKGAPQVVLRDGEVINAELYDISGTSPLVVSVKMRDGGLRLLGSTQISRILIARPSTVIAAAKPGGRP